MLRSKVFSFFVAFLALTTIVTARKHHKHHHEDESDDNVSDAIIVVDEIDGDSRAELGDLVQQKPAPWHGQAWTHNPQTRPQSHLIQVGKNHVLADQNLPAQIQAQGHPPTQSFSPLKPSTWQKAEKPANFVMPQPNRYDRNKGVSASTDSHVPVVDHSKYTPVQQVGNNNFQLYHQERGPMAKEHNPAHLPKLERDPNNMGKDCHMYAWGPHSGGAAGSSRSDGIDPNNYHYQKIPVETLPGSSCKNGKCSLSVKPGHRGQHCGRKQGDVGAPVLCGPDNKLTYVTTRGKRSANDCYGAVDAIHTSSLIPGLKDQVPDLNY